MTHYRTYGILNIILFTCVICVCGDLQDFFELQQRKAHPPLNFNGHDFYNTEDKAQQAEDHDWNQENIRGLVASTPALPRKSNFSYNFDPNIKWEKNWTSSSGLGQLSAVDIDPSGNVAIFCRRSRTWGQDTFTIDNRFDPHKGPIPENVIILLNKEGKKILEWGSNTFYLPHGLTIDWEGNYWLTDVAMHMVMKFSVSSIKSSIPILKKAEGSSSRETQIDLNNLFRDSIVKPVLVLGDPFQPGNDNQRFCKPTAVAVMRNGDFFVSDGYCNSRIVKFNSRGERISQFGRFFSPGLHQHLSPYALSIPHAMALAEELGLLYVADREDGRILSFQVQNGTFHREYRDPAIGTKIYSVAYAQGRIYAVNGPDFYQSFHVRGFSIDIQSGEIISQFGPDEDMKTPHDLAVSKDASQIYVVELDNHVVYKFLQARVSPTSGASTEKIPLKDGFELLTSPGLGQEPKKMRTVTIALVSVISSIIVIGLCIAVAALFARCQKRGSLSRLHESHVEFKRLVD